MKKEKTKILKERYAGSFTGKKSKVLVTLDTAKEKKPQQEQKNLFGDKDQLYNTLQEEISIVVAMIQVNHESIDKKKEQNVGLQKRKDNLERAARTAAKMRDEELSKKKEEKLKR